MSIKWAIGVLAISAMLSAAASGAESVDIKGFYAGMEGYELKGHLKDFCYLEGCALSRKTRFTVGEVKGKFLAAKYDSAGAAELIAFQFDSFGFQRLQSAMLEKFPETKCIKSTVITRLGLTVPQMLCAFETEKDGIYLLRVAGNINRSTMFVMTAQARQELRQYVADANNDL
jgi:hypothetical protein